MKSKAELRRRLEAIEADERLHYPAAGIWANAPLALVQTELRASAQILRWVLDMPPRAYHGRDGDKQID